MCEMMSRWGLRAGNRRGAGEGVTNEGVPQESWRNSLATRGRIGTKRGAPFIQHQAVTEPIDRAGGWEGEFSSARISV